MNCPAITVVMSIFNEPKEWLKESIESILNQSFTDFEFLIVNDNPKRSTNAEQIEGYRRIDRRIRLIENIDNIGLTRSLNKAFEQARGTYIARMDADDIAIKTRLETQVHFMETHPEIGVCGSWCNYFGKVHLFSMKTNKLPQTHTQICIALPFYNPLVHPTAFFRQSSIQHIQPLYDEQFRNAQDYLLWEKLMQQKIQFANIQQVLLRYRVSTIQISTKNKTNQNRVASDIRLRWLEERRFIQNEKQKEIILQLTNQEFFEQFEQLKEKENLLLEIRAFLTGLYPDESRFVNTILHEQWVRCFQCFTQKRKYSATLVTSPLFQIRRFSPRDFIKVFLF